MTAIAARLCNGMGFPAATTYIRCLSTTKNSTLKDLVTAEKSLVATLVGSKGSKVSSGSERARKGLVVVQACANCGDIMRAEAWLAALAFASVPLGVRAFNAMLLTCARAEDLERAEWWFFEMIERDVDPNVFSFNMLLNAAAEVRDVSAVEKWFTRMLEARVSPDKVTYRTAIAASARGGNAPLAEEWLSRMQSAMHVPDVLSYTSIISAHASSGSAAGAEHWLRKMLDAGVKADHVGYNLVICTWATDGNMSQDQLAGRGNGHPQRAESWMWKALEAGIEPTDATMHKLLASFVRAEDYTGAERVQGVMRRLKQWPSAAACAILARPQAAAGDFEAVEALLTELQESDHQPDVACLRALLTAYARSPRPPRAKSEDCVQQLFSLGAFTKKSLEVDQQQQLLKDLRQALGKQRYYELAAAMNLRSTPALNLTARHRIVGRCIAVEPS